MSGLFATIKKIFVGSTTTTTTIASSAGGTLADSPVPKKQTVVLQNNDAMWHLSAARKAEEQGDFLAARMGYLKCVETLKRDSDTVGLNEATKEYECFVKRDPIFEKLLSTLLPFIKANPGTLQSEITKKADSLEWPALYNHNRPVSREDIYYALYFADKFGDLHRTKKGRSYELRVPNL
ncbi:MAG TPA: hypothetical protein ENK33_06345 [Desulfobacterales bacterium]|nr:hypothetical protein [Desulfobacterales bacterium]